VLRHGAEASFVRVRNATDCDENGSTHVVVDADVMVSRRLDLSIRALLAVRRTESGIHMETRECAWGNAEVTIVVSPNEEISDETVVECTFVFSNVVLSRIAYPLIDSKLATFASTLNAALERALLSATWRQRFLLSFDDVVRRRISSSLADIQCDKVWAHYDKMLSHTVLGGKAYRPLMVFTVMKDLMGRALTETEDRYVMAAGWICELTQAMCLVADDIMDGSETRRGQPCWYKVVTTPLAINDTLTLYSAIYEVLGETFKGTPYLETLLLLFKRVALETTYGQMMDSSEEGTCPRNMSMERYRDIVRMKTAVYTFHCPIGMALILSGVWDSHVELECLQLSNVLGTLFQIQDDYLDVFGDPSVTGKIGTDIRDGKCTWMILFAMETADDATRDELCACYGTEDGEQRVREIFCELGVHKEYARLCDEETRKFEGACVDTSLKHAVFPILRHLLHRKK